MNFLKDNEQLKAVALQPCQPLAVTSRLNPKQRAVASLYNRLGGLFEKLSQETGVDLRAALAVWVVESSAAPFIPKRAMVRVEIHQLYEEWGKRNRTAFENHFRFGGHGQQPGNPWENQEYRTQTSGLYSSVHHNQTAEYAALTLSRLVAGDETALSCTSIGGCQIMMDSFKLLGYENILAMYNAFQASETAHVFGFFDFCRAKPAPKVGDLIRCLQAKDWLGFGKSYNGSGQVQAYATALQTTYETASVLLAPSQAA